MNITIKDIMNIKPNDIITINDGELVVKAMGCPHNHNVFTQEDSCTRIKAVHVGGRFMGDVVDGFRLSNWDDSIAGVTGIKKSSQGYGVEYLIPHNLLEP